MSKKYDCIFLDRDGTINTDPGYISKLQDFKFFDFAVAALDMLKTLTNNFRVNYTSLENFANFYTGVFLFVNIILIFLFSCSRISSKLH